MSVFEAVRRNHTKLEDRLTAAVFGTLEIVDRSRFLAPVLKKGGVDLDAHVNPNKLEFHYWLCTGRRTPDVVIRENSGKRVNIVIECKLNDEFDVDQLVEGYQDVPNCHLIAISHHWVEPHEIQQARDRLINQGFRRPRLHWTRWQDIYAILNDGGAKGSRTEKGLIRDLVVLLDRKGLRMFDGFNKKQLKAASRLASQWNDLYDFSGQCDALFLDVEARLGNKHMDFSPFAIQLGHTKDGMENWTGLRAWDHSWTTQHGGSERSRIGPSTRALLAELHLDPNKPEESPELVVGYQLWFTKDIKKGKLLREKFVKRVEKPNAADAIRKSPYSVMFWHVDESDWVRDRVIQARDLPSNWTSEQVFRIDFNDADAIIFGCIFGSESLTSKNLAKKIAEYIVELRDFVTKNSLHIAGDYD
ncbi:MAG: hypothetical protein QUS09_10660 [Methanotrichaceae archaeon]|nr:hypothetical protein [Methanotrichaceae archaeon]